MGQNILQLEEKLKILYGEDKEFLNASLQRYKKIENEFTSRFGNGEYHFFSTPGRVEISGNHTDHNHGKVLTAAIGLDSVAVAGKNSFERITLYSENFDETFTVNLDELDVIANERGSSSALIRGIVSRIQQLGYQIGGFDAYVSSGVLPGSGLSSSASFEVLIGTILNHLFNESRISSFELAQIGQYAENNYFAKPCGLMDQLACATGGIIGIDFKDPLNPEIDKIDMDFNSNNYKLLVVNTGGSHEDLTDEYASVPSEMKSVAAVLGGEVLRDIRMDDFLPEIPRLREKVGDRAILRAYHFFKENERVTAQVSALKKEDFKQFLSLVNESGESSFTWLQNIYVNASPGSQGVALGLALSKEYLEKNSSGACRIHGGGFAGTIIAIMEAKVIEGYIDFLSPLFGEESISILSIRNHGTVCLDDLA